VAAEKVFEEVFDEVEVEDDSPAPVGKADPSFAASVPPELCGLVESTFDRYFCPYLSLPLTAGAGGWQPWFESDGVVCRSKQEGDVMCVRGDCTMPVAAAAVFRYALDAARCKDFIPLVVEARPLRSFTPHCWARMLKFEKVWPVAQRYFVELCHWCLLPDGRVAVHGRSALLDSLHAPEPAAQVRGTMHFNNILIEPRGPAGCAVTYFAKVCD
jgi:hypothetical protein